MENRTSELRIVDAGGILDKRHFEAIMAAGLFPFYEVVGTCYLSGMKSELLDSLMQSPLLPELIDEAHRAFAEEQKRRAKFYADITPEHKWEFIQGEVIMHSPVLARHAMAMQRTYNLLNAFTQVHDVGNVYVEKAMTVFPRNDYEPDIAFFGHAKSAQIGPDTLRFPIPDLIVEVVSPSTEARDRGIKFQDYALHGVGEYWIIDPAAETVEVYRLQGDAYPAADRQQDGTLSSHIVPGFEIPVRAIFDGAENLAALRRFLAAN